MYAVLHNFEFPFYELSSNQCVSVQKYAIQETAVQAASLKGNILGHGPGVLT